MKIRFGFVSNSSSTSFTVYNNTDKNFFVHDFLKEITHLVKEYNTAFGYKIKVKDFLKDGKDDPRILRPGKNIINFGDEDGTTHGKILDYMLREKGSSEHFSWEFYEYLR